MKVVAVPRDRNPFQEALYGPLRRRGFDIGYLDGPTPSRTANLLLMPAVLALRARGARCVLHVHWVFGFVPGSAALRRAALLWRLWFVLVLTTARAVGYRVVWTAHNVLPHAPVFDDDVAARRALVARCDAVVAMNDAAARAVTERFAPQCPVRVIPHGHTPAAPAAADAVERTRRGLGAGPDAFVVLFFGRVEPYKGVTDLMVAWAAAALPADAVLVVVGECRDASLRGEIERLAASAPGSVRLRLESVPDGEVSALLGAADALVYPFRAISTSGSLLTGLGSGRPCLATDLPAFAEVPDAALLRTAPEKLGHALEDLVRMPHRNRDALATAGLAYVSTLGWDEIAGRYADVFAEITSP